MFYAKTAASLTLVVMAIVVNLVAIVFAVIYLSGKNPAILSWIVGFFVAAFVLEIALRLLTGRIVLKRIKAG